MSTTQTDPSPSLDAASAQSLIADSPDTLVVDVRTPGEFETAHIPQSVNIPLDQVDGHAGRIVSAAGRRPMLVLCQSGPRSVQAREKLAAAGLAGVSVLDGGMNAWVAAGAPVESTGKARWSLERQVRLVAGSIVLLSVIASIWVPGMRFVAGLIGAGLVFAAVSNTCMMGNLLGRLPYNRGAGADVDTAITRLSR